MGEASPEACRAAAAAAIVEEGWDFFPKMFRSFPSAELSLESGTTGLGAAAEPLRPPEPLPEPLRPPVLPSEALSSPAPGASGARVWTADSPVKAFFIESFSEHLS